MKIYYAHHLWKYNTLIEQYEIDLIRTKFPDATIVNPNTDIEQEREESEIMMDCIFLAKSCDAVVFSSVNGVIGRGVYDEVLAGKSTYYISNNKIISFNGTLEIIQNSYTDRIYATVNFK